MDGGGGGGVSKGGANTLKPLEVMSSLLRLKDGV